MQIKNDNEMFIYFYRMRRTSSFSPSSRFQFPEVSKQRKKWKRKLVRIHSNLFVFHNLYSAVRLSYFYFQKKRSLRPTLFCSAKKIMNKVYFHVFTYIYNYRYMYIEVANSHFACLSWHLFFTYWKLLFPMQWNAHKKIIYSFFCVTDKLTVDFSYFLHNS